MKLPPCEFRSFKLVLVVLRDEFEEAPGRRDHLYLVANRPAISSRVAEPMGLAGLFACCGDFSISRLIWRW